MPVNNKRIAKNTMILYGRMVIMMLIGLYTSRVVLQNLGVDDYGIYGTVGGIVGFMGFINGALATSSSRFLTFALGKGNLVESRKTFTTTFTVHLLLGVLIFIIGEMIGPWMIANKLIIPSGRIMAAQIAFQFSLVTTSLGISQVPYSATIVAHEDMGIYAYMAIWDVFAKLAVAMSLNWWGGDKLVFFAAILCLNSIGVQMFYRVYCAKKYEEALTRIHIDKPIFKEIAGFSGWNLLNSFITALNAQGTTVMIGMFFSPVVAAARAISIKVNHMSTQFIGNFRQAMNPQIIKLYAYGEQDEFKKMTLQSGQYSFFIMWIIALPMCLLSTPIMEIWLKTPPKNADYYSALLLIDSLFWLFDASFQQGIIATGELKRSTVYYALVNIFRFPILYTIFVLGGDAVWAYYISIIAGSIVGCVIKPYLLIKQCGFNVMDFVRVFVNSLKIVILSSLIPVGLSFQIQLNGFGGVIFIGTLSMLSVIFTIYFCGIDASARSYIQKLVAEKTRGFF